MTLQDRVWLRIDIGPSDACWIWKGNRDKDGYGQITVRFRDSSRRRNFRISRLILEWKLQRSLYPGCWALHRCDNPACCNPQHLFEGDNRANVADRQRKGRSAKNPTTPIQEIRAARPEIIPHGEGHCRAKLSEAQVLEIAELRSKGETQVALASRFQVGRTTIRSILDGRNWKHLKLDPIRKGVGEES